MKSATVSCKDSSSVIEPGIFGSSASHAPNWATTWVLKSRLDLCWWPTVPPMVHQHTHAVAQQDFRGIKETTQWFIEGWRVCVTDTCAQLVSSGILSGLRIAARSSFTWLSLAALSSSSGFLRSSLLPITVLISLMSGGWRKKSRKLTSLLPAIIVLSLLYWPYLLRAADYDQWTWYVLWSLISIGGAEEEDKEAADRD